MRTVSGNGRRVVVALVRVGMLYSRVCDAVVVTQRYGCRFRLQSAARFFVSRVSPPQCQPVRAAFL